MIKSIHRGHVELGEGQLGATLTLEPGGVLLEVASPAGVADPPERVELLRFTSNTGYFTLIHLFRRTHNMRLGVGGLSTYGGGLAFESGYFSTLDEIQSQSWSMTITDIAKVLHVNGVIQQFMLPQDGGFVMHWTIAPPQAVDLVCADANITVRLGQHIRTSGNAIDGPTVSLSYPADLLFPEEVSPETALRMMHRVRQFFSLMMGRVLPITGASVRFDIDDNAHEMPIHGLRTTESSDKPEQRLLSVIDANALGQMLNRWLARYDELEDAISLHMSGLEQRRLPSELRFQIFVQALEALHRRTAPAATAPIDAAPILATLRSEGVASDVVDRISGVLAHAHEPGLRQRLRYYWELMAGEIAILRPMISRGNFIGRVAATRNHYAHRTDRDAQVLEGIDLWDATETVKAMSHIALFMEMGADVAGIGQAMLDRRFAEFAMRD